MIGECEPLCQLTGERGSFNSRHALNLSSVILQKVGAGLVVKTAVGLHQQSGASHHGEPIVAGEFSLLSKTNACKTVLSGNRGNEESHCGIGEPRW